MAVREEQVWKTEVRASFSIPSLHRDQIDAIQGHLDRKDTFLSVCTGGGKSPLYTKATEKHALFAFCTMLTAVDIVMCDLHFDPKQMLALL